MKKILPSSFALLIIILLALLNSCVKDTCKSTYTYTIYTPVYETVAQLEANIKSGPPEEVENPGKIVLLGHYIFLNEIEKGIHILTIPILLLHGMFPLSIFPEIWTWQ